MRKTSSKFIRHFCSALTCASFLAPTAVQANGRVYSWGGDGNCDGRPCHADTSWISNVVAIAAGAYQSLALKPDGTVIAWGANADTNFPSGLSNIVAISACGDLSMALRANGRVAMWGSGASDPPANVVPALQDVAAISAGFGTCLVLRSNGTVVAWGANPLGQGNSSGQTNVPPTMTNITAISLGAFHALALRSDGTVAAWPPKSSLGCYDYCNLDFGQVDIPPGLNNVVAIAAGCSHSLALKGDGTVVAWGGGGANVPPGLSNVVAISAGDGISLALKSDGTLVEWLGSAFFSGVNLGQRTTPTSLSNVVAIASGGGGSTTHNLALYSAEPIIRTQPASRSVMAGDNVLFSVSATSPGPLTYQWRFNGTNIAGATTGTLAITNAQPSNTGYYDVLVCSSFGCVTSQVATLSFKIANLQMMAVVTVQGMVGANTRVEWSPDLITWSTLTNFVLPASPYRVPDWDSLGQPQKFYRVLFLP